MSTRSIIAKQIGEDQYLTIFCHYNGYPDDNGARLVKHYNTPERVDALLALGDLEILREKTEPSPQTPHTADAPQPGVTVAMRRDMELSGCEAVEMIREELIEPEYEGIEYTYIFNQDGKWLYFPVGEEYEWRDLSGTKISKKIISNRKCMEEYKCKVYRESGLFSFGSSTQRIPASG